MILGLYTGQPTTNTHSLVGRLVRTNRLKHQAQKRMRCFFHVADFRVTHTHAHTRSISLFLSHPAPGMDVYVPGRVIRREPYHDAPLGGCRSPSGPVRGGRE